MAAAESLHLVLNRIVESIATASGVIRALPIARVL